MSLSETAINAAIKHAKQTYPEESCGVIVDGEYYPRVNRHPNPEQRFRIDSLEFTEIADLGNVEAIVHSHPDTLPKASMADIQGCRISDYPWLIVSPKIETWTLIEPAEDPLPLLDRDFTHGVVDCYTLIQDYYNVELGIELPTPVRRDDWWLNGENLYLDNIKAAGFSRVMGEGGNNPSRDQIQPHDVVLMFLQSDVPNHGGVITEDYALLHHPAKRKSKRNPYGGYWEKFTHSIWRHESIG